MTVIDERVVAMKFDGKQFQQGVGETQGVLKKLNESFKFAGAGEGLGKIARGIKGVDTSSLASGVEAVTNKFSALQTIAVGALLNVGAKIGDLATNTLKKFTLDPVLDGFREYELKMGSVQTIFSNVKDQGKSLQDVTGALDNLNKYADKTIYNFGDMTKNIGLFTAAGVDLDRSVATIKGMSNAAALFGADAQSAARASYQMSQAMASGTIKLMDWNSLQNAGMGGTKMQEAIKQTARVHGVAVDDIIKKEGSFRDSLSKGWLTADIFAETMARFAGEYTDDQLRSMGYTEEQIRQSQELAETATNAATKVKTFTQLMDTLGEAAGSGWAQTWELLLGDFETATNFFTALSDMLGGALQQDADFRNQIAQNFVNSGGREAALNTILNLLKAIGSWLKPIRDALQATFGPGSGEAMAGVAKALEKFTAGLILSEGSVKNLTSVFKGLLAPFKIAGSIIGAVLRVIGELIALIPKGETGFLQFAGGIGEWLHALAMGLDESDFFYRKLHELVEYAKKIGDYLGPGFDKASETVRRWSENAAGYLSQAAVDIKPAVQDIKDRASELGESLRGKVSRGFEIVSEKVEASREVLDKAGEAFEKFKAQVSRTGEKIAEFAQKVKTFFEPAVRAVKGFIDRMRALIVEGLTKLGGGDLGKGFDRLLGGLAFGGLAAMLHRVTGSITGVFTQFGDGLGQITGSIAEGLKGTFDQLAEGIKTLQASVKVKMLLNIAIALGILAAACWVLAQIPSKQLGVALGSMFGMMAGLTAVMFAVTKLDMSGSVASGIRAALMITALSVALLILATAMSKMAKLSWNEVAKGLTSTVVLLFAVAGVMKLLDGSQSKLFGSALGMIAIAVAVRILVGAVERLGAIDLGTLTKGLLSVVTLLLTITALNKLGGSGMGVGTGIAMVGIAVGIKMLAEAVNQFGSMDLGTLAKGVGSVVLLMAAIAGMGLAGVDKMSIAMGIGFVGLGKGILNLAQSVAYLGGIDLDSLIKGLGALIVVMGGMAMAVRAMPSNMLAISVGVLAMSAGVSLLASAVGAMANIPFQNLLKGLLGLSLILAAVALASKAMTGSLVGAAAVLVMAIAIQALIPPLLVLSAMPLAALGVGLIGLIGAFAALAIGGLLVAPVVPVLLALGIALGLFSIAALAGGIAMGLLATAFGVMAAVGVAGATALGAALVILAAQLPIIMLALVGAITAFVVALAAATPALVQGFTTIGLGILQVVKNLVPEIVSTLMLIITDFLVKVAAALPQITQAAFDILLALLTGIAENIGEVTSTVAAIITEFLTALAGEMPGIVSAGLELLAGFLQGVSEGIGDVVVAALHVVAEFLRGIAEKIGDVITQGADLIVALIDGISKEYSRIVEAALTGVGRFIEGLGKGATRLIKSGKEMCLQVLKGITESVSDFVQQAFEIAIKFLDSLAETFRNQGDRVVQSVINLGGSIIQGLGRGLVESARKFLRKAIETVTGWIPQWIKDRLGIRSPSRVTKELGRFAGMGLAQGIFGERHNVGRSSFDVASAAVDGISQALAKASDMTADVNPKITPVVDLSEVKKSARSLSGILGGSPTSTVNANARRIGGPSEDPGAHGGSVVNNNHTEYNQYITSPKALTVADIERGTIAHLNKKGGFSDH